MSNWNMHKKNNMAQRRIGWDIGGVLCPRGNAVGDPMPLPNPKALAMMRAQHAQGFPLFIVSYMGPKRVAQNRKWLCMHRIVPDLVPWDNVIMVGSDKRVKLAVVRCLQLTDFYDDSPVVLESLKDGATDKRRRGWLKAEGTRGESAWVSMEHHFPDMWPQACWAPKGWRGAVTLWT
jgi:hypothetical protein